MVVTNAANPEPLNRIIARGNRSDDPDYVPEDSDYFDNEDQRPKQNPTNDDHHRAMEDLRAEMMSEIKKLKARQGGGSLEEDDAVLCRYFPSSLKRSALSWFDNLPPKSINSYGQLTEKFFETYMYNKVVNVVMNKLFSLATAYKETIREYTDRWHRIFQAIGNVDLVVSINCYKWGLDRMIPLFVEIHGSVRKKKGDLRVIIEKHASLEEIQRENPRAQAQRSHRTNYVEQTNRSKRGGSAERPNDDKRGRRDDRRRDDRKFEDQLFTKLNTNYARILREIKGRENLEWPWSKGKHPPKSEKSRDYYEYHCFNGHRTEKCKNLKIMIQKLIDAGDLKQYIQKEENEDRTKRSKKVQIPEGNITVNTISCSEATGTSLTSQIWKMLRKQFEDYWCNIKKILIDGGSSVNVLFYYTFKRMELNDEQLMSLYYTIYGFNGAPTKPLGDIVLKVDAGPIKVDT
ncbi:uncharacterized protein LOC113280060 [Papaver somniferum]|uniref:uncharacterized protein LOC113280060 n=1 Tax=Papaver somniferum TaxID=3469 RepID=UPI000E6FEDCF|nr:uncharacterized protein LOC113280060 [Papaver somniferum]